jgi:hypothetical protein
MKKLLGSAGVAVVLLAASVMPSSAITCGANCTGITPSIGPSLTGAFGDGGFTGAMVDDFLFTPPGPAAGYLSNSDEITVSQGVISNLTIAVYALVGSVLQAINTTATVVAGEQFIHLDSVPVTTGVSYYVELTGSCTGTCAYGGTEILNVNTGGNQGLPLPAALPLFAAGLGLLGFWGRRRQKQALV